jgi:hypothetical protein
MFKILNYILIILEIKSIYYYLEWIYIKQILKENNSKLY